MDTDRRSFLKLLGIGAVTTILPQSILQEVETAAFVEPEKQVYTSLSFINKRGEKFYLGNLLNVTFEQERSHSVNIGGFAQRYATPMSSRLRAEVYMDDPTDLNKFGSTFNSDLFNSDVLYGTLHGELPLKYKNGVDKLLVFDVDVYNQGYNVDYMVEQVTVAYDFGTISNPVVQYL